MKNLIRAVAAVVISLPCIAVGGDLSLKWGLENNWSYSESLQPDYGETRPKAKAKKYRTFTLSGREVTESLRKCLERHFKIWDEYKVSLVAQPGQPKPDKKDFEKFKAERDPFCDQHAVKQAPVLYFDFIARSGEQYVLEAIEVTTLDFAEYKGGGFFKEEAWYDIVLQHKKGIKRFDVAKRLVFSGNGRCELRFWSDNFDASHGWSAPMGEYMIDIKFIFSAGGKRVSVSTGTFRMDV
ncbi:MAG: hypothetical protein ACOYL3_11240 [Desulfuromonadaceae bacterium]